MKKIFVFIFLLLFILLIFIFRSGTKTSVNLSKNNLPQTKPSITKTPVTKTSTSSIFIPYWSISDNKLNLVNNQLIYFGIEPNNNEINTQEPGYKTINEFIEDTKGIDKKILAIRMIDTNNNLSILSSKSSQSTIISQSLKIAKDNNFNGVLLDLEISAISFNSLVSEINSFVKSYSQEAKSNNLSFSIAIYGDSFYRARPFDVKTIGENVDKIYILSYDFSKSQGANPGPNFPFSGSKTYGYDFKSMIADFLSQVPAQKLSIVYGMFGYDWSVDSKGLSTMPAEPLTLVQIQKKFLNGCSFKNCKIDRDNASSETKIIYTDSANQNHIVWFEDQKSAAEKQSYARGNGILDNGIWAYSYY